MPPLPVLTGALRLARQLAAPQLPRVTTDPHGHLRMTWPDGSEAYQRADLAA